MRADQIQRLHDLSEKLADSFLSEADPAEWPGNGQSMADITAQQRGDRYWCKKNAMATGGVLRYTLDLLNRTGPAGGPEDPADDADLDRRIAQAEQRAAAAVEQALKRAKRLAEDVGGR